MGGTASAFKMNVDGVSTVEADNITLDANDSLYVFVQVNVDTSAINLPFIVRDSVLISYNGNTDFVQLQAYGQNANYYKNKVLTGNVTWTNTRPYVILGSLTIDTTATLTIQPGTRIYSHANAPILVNGSLKCTGTKALPITFAGDRIDPDYRDLPASWPGIIFLNTAKDNVMQFSNIKNAYQAIFIANPAINGNPKLTLSQCIIDNAYNTGLLAINTSIRADNCLISNCGSNIFLALGGDYNFTHCTVASYGNFYIPHLNPVLQVSNFATQGTQVVLANLNAIFRNCIFWGDGGTIDDEVIVQKQGTGNFNVTFDHDLYKVVNDPANATLTSVYKNQAPMFDSINTNKQYYDFHFNQNPTSPAINKGVVTSFLRDLDDRPRANGLPDLGCYER